MAVTVLLIDDNLDQITITRRALDANNYMIDTASNALEGLKKLLAFTYDVVLCDYRLPAMSGVELLKQMKAHRRDVPFIIVTAAGNERVAVEAMQEGAYDYLVKDVAYEVLLPGVIQRTIDRHRDRQERKRTEAALRIAYDRLRETQAHLVQSEKLAALGQFAAGVAHEVKNPLHIIAVSAHMLSKASADSRKAADLLTEIQGAVKRADKIIRGLLEFSKPSALQLKPDDLNRILEECLHVLNTQLGLHQVTVKRSLAASPPLLMLDEEQMRQAFTNVIMNAVEAMPQGGQVLVRTSVKELTQMGGRVGRRATDRFTPGQRIMICEVEDAGVGIPASSLTQVFDPFFTTKAPDGGTGLGLSITKTIVEAHGGTIEIRSQEGAGTTVAISLPLAELGAAASLEPAYHGAADA